ncbi:MAG: right-handed parallel beta-helix repeat-containing protein, partial [Gammaproteobacteria bacterium]|nr:right-handed parallel beta-helix repeat-containing protein [Gammaproteobacteria bacterium]
VSIRGDNVTVKNSIVRQNWGEGINYWLSPNGGDCYDNLVYDNYALQIYMDRAIDVTVERNLIYFSTSSEFYRGGSPSSGIVINNETNTHLSDNLMIRNNFILGCYAGIDQWATNYPVTDMAIINNTIIDCDEYGIRLLGTSSQTNLRCKNNIVYQTSGDVVYVETSNGWTFSHNCWYGGGTVDGDAVSGDDVTSDPLLDRGDTKGPGELDAWHFKIDSGSSPCIGAALEDSDSPVDDYYGTTRSDDDMGGHEYGGGDIEVQAPLGTLALTGHVPIVIATGDIEIQIPLGALVLTGHAPTAIATEDVEIQTPLGTLVLTGHVPIVTAGIGVQVPLGVLVLTGQVPSITVTANQNVRVPLGALSLIGHVPVIAVAGSVEVQIPAGILVLTGYAPIVATTGAMNSFIVLDGHRYKCMHEDWRPKRSKSSSAQYTLSGNLDMTYGTVTSFEWEGNILAPVTPDDETYGDIDDLRATLAKRTPLSYRDYYGDEYTVHVIGPFTEESRSPMW